MAFNKRRMESERAAAAAKEAEARRALGPQVLADAERPVVTWNARQEGHMPMLFSPTIGAAITARHWFLWVRCPACRTTMSIDLRHLDRFPTRRLVGHAAGIAPIDAGHENAPLFIKLLHHRSFCSPSTPASLPLAKRLIYLRCDKAGPPNATKEGSPSARPLQPVVDLLNRESLSPFCTFAIR